MPRVFSVCTVVACAALLGFASLAHAELGYGSEPQAAKGEWSRMYDEASRRSFASMNGMDRYTLVALAHLSSHNQIGFEWRHRLTEADWASVKDRMPSPESPTNMEAGEALLYAEIAEIHGDYNDSFKYTKRGMSILKRAAEEAAEYSRSELYALGEIEKETQAMAGVTGFLTLLNPDAFSSDASPLALAGKLYRTMNEIEANAKRLGVALPGADSSKVAAASDASDTTKDASIVAPSSPAAAYKIPAPPTASQLRDAATIDTLLSRGFFVPFFAGYRASVLQYLGQESSVANEFYRATLNDPQCQWFWKGYLDHETSKDALDRLMGQLKTRAKGEKSDSNVALFMGELHIAMGKPDKAVAIDTEWLKEHPSHSVALGQRAHAYYAMKNMAGASKDAADAIAAEAGNYDAWYTRALIAKAANDPAANEYYAQVLKFAPWGLAMRSEAEAALAKGN